MNFQAKFHSQGLTGLVSAFAATTTHVDLEKLWRNYQGISREDKIELLGSASGFSSFDGTSSASKRYIKSAVDAEVSVEFSADTKCFNHLDKHTVQVNTTCARIWTKIEALQHQELEDGALKAGVKIFKSFFKVTDHEPLFGGFQKF